MKKYVSPVVELNNDLAEGVFLASGGGNVSDADCWTVAPLSVQNWDGSSHVFEVHAAHSDSVEHISSASTVTLTFNYPLTSARSEFPCVVSGNTVTITRTLLADAYKSGDNVTYKVWASTGDQASTEALAVTSATISCTKSVNVQGGGADGN